MAPDHDRFVGRTREIGQIRSALDTPEASIVRVQGMRGVGKSAVVARALQGFQALTFVVPALPEPLQLAALARLVGDGTEDGAGGVEAGDPTPSRGPATDPVTPPSPSWSTLFETLAARPRPGRPPFVLVLDDAHRLVESRARWLPALATTLRRARAERRIFHVVLVGPASPWEPAGAPPEFDADTVEVGPLPLRPATSLLPGRTPRDLLRAYAVLGGIPRVLAHVERDLTLETNIRKLMLEPEAPFADLPALWLERDLQTPSRYNAILHRISWGESDWSAVHEAVPDLGSSGQLAPYVKRLDDLGLLSVRRSLDALPTGRARRYHATDPFLAFWYRFRLTGSPDHPPGRTTEERIRALRGTLEEHLATVFPRICRQHMSHDARETLGANARELGSLWGTGREIPVAGLLTSGAAFYGFCAWRPPVRGEDTLETLELAVRETRYGFGREHRLRLLFTATDPPRWLQRDAVRREQWVLIGPSQLVGG